MGDEQKHLVEKENEEKEKEKQRKYQLGLELVFWTFAGSSSGKKKLYMSIGELNCFLDIVHLNDAQLCVTADTMLDVLGKDEDETRITCNDFVDYFCDAGLNPQCEQIKDYLAQQPKWIALHRALKIFDIVDKDKSGSIDYSEFITFCKLIGEENPSKVEDLWHSIDEDENGEVVIHELFGWYQKRLSTQE